MSMRTSRRIRTIPAIAAILLGAGAAAPAQQGARDGEWRYYGGDSGSTKYSPLDQIDRGNVADLDIAWRWRSDNFGPRLDFNYQATPLAVGGVLYTSAGWRRNVVAIDGATGETLWMYRLDEGDRGDVAPVRASSGRGVAYWTDGGDDARIIHVTRGYHLVALDAATGYPIPGFGDQGRRRPLRRDLRRARPPGGGERPDRPELARPRRRRRHRGGGGAARHRPRARVRGRVRARVRRAHRRAAMDLPHHPPAGRVRQRHVGERLVALQREHRRMGPDVGRPGARLRVPARRDPHQRPLRRPSARRQPVRGEPGVSGREDRRARLALPAHPSRHLGLRHPHPAGAGRHHRRRPANQGGGAGDQAGVHLRVRPGHGRAGVADRGTSGAPVDGARRAGRADPAVSHPARPLRPPGGVGRRPPRLHAGAERRGAAHRVGVPARADLHPADSGGGRMAGAHC